MSRGKGILDAAGIDTVVFIGYPKENIYNKNKTLVPISEIYFI
jgi:hypothetical protein